MQGLPRLGATAMIMTESTMGETGYKERKFKCDTERTTS
jgi:hypothetical protein